MLVLSRVKISRVITVRMPHQRQSWTLHLMGDLSWVRGIITSQTLEKWSIMRFMVKAEKKCSRVYKEVTL